MSILTRNQFLANISRFHDVIRERLYNSRPDLNIRVSNSYLKKNECNPFIICYIDFTDNISVSLTIIYNDTYNVPEVHFRFFDNGKLTFSLLGDNDLSFIINTDKLILDDHPIFGEPWFSIHQCEVKFSLDDILGHSLKNLLSPSGRVLLFFMCWFNTYGLSCIFPFLSLRINIEEIRDIK